MAYSAPPGLTGSSGSSLPAKPPPPAFHGFAPRSVAAKSGNSSAPSINRPGVTAAPTNYSDPHSQYNSHPGQNQGGFSHGYHASSQFQPSSYGGYGDQAATQNAVPTIRNPFAPMSAAASQYDPEMDAQIAQWQSAYTSNEDGNRRGFNAHNGIGQNSGSNALGSKDLQDIAKASGGDSGVASVVTGADGKRKTVVRHGGGKTWQDDSLVEWDPAHFRLFVGNLAGEVTDDSLFKAFSKYSTLQRARVVRDKRSTKSKGYGFVSFSDGDEYFQAAKDMQGKYIGSHPILLRKSTTEIKASTPKDNNRKRNNDKSKGSGYDSMSRTGAGVSKKPSKTKGGLRIIG